MLVYRDIVQNCDRLRFISHKRLFSFRLTIAPFNTEQTATVTCFLCRRKVRERTREKRHQRKESERSVLSKADGLKAESKLVTPTSQPTFQLGQTHRFVSVLLFLLSSGCFILASFIWIMYLYQPHGGESRPKRCT